ncbi:hypothetical protein RR46_14522 [Papilio xuthus]|uniref:Uncharacterized protein n=1 Tax=Papilio xuthus TaxID=66420 RepID=A0A194PDD1_PAPXU|nr:hypothetical protein RR46_14522 [Papilio xuthus]
MSLAHCIDYVHVDYNLFTNRREADERATKETTHVESVHVADATTADDDTQTCDGRQHHGLLAVHVPCCQEGCAYCAVFCTYCTEG